MMRTAQCLLQHAFWNRSTAAVRAALAAGASSDTPVQLTHHRGENPVRAWAGALCLAWVEGIELLPPAGLTPYAREAILRWAPHGHLPAYQAFLAHLGPDAPARFARNNLRAAAEAGMYEVVRACLDAGADPDGEPGSAPPLGRAAGADIARLLLARGARPAGRPGTELRKTPIVQAARRSTDVLRLLLHARAPLSDTEKLPVLLAAAQARSADNLRLLDAYGLDIGPILPAALALATEQVGEDKILDLLELGADPDRDYVTEDFTGNPMTFPSLRDVCRKHAEHYPRATAWLAEHAPPAE